MNRLTLDAIRACLDGAVPSIMATCARDGTPNVTYLSHAAYVDPEHLALSFQFFSKTRQNVLENPRARLLVWHPATAEMYRLEVRYLRTETEGPLFERMRAMIAGIASHTGMDGVFCLRGADVYRVMSIEAVPARSRAPDVPRRARLAGLRQACAGLIEAPDLDALFRGALDALAHHLEITHAMVLAHDPARTVLYAVATLGYAEPGVGAEIPLGAGVIGVAARERVPIRLTHLTSDRSYLEAVRERSSRAGVPAGAEVAWPGLRAPGSQVAVPIVAGGTLLGVLFAESPSDGRFDYDDEDALATFAEHLGACMVALERMPDERTPDESEHERGAAVAPDASGKPAVLRHYRADDTVFLDDEYVIKGVAGAILWAMASDHAQSGRTAFTNRELRLDPRIPLPELGDNLEARLVLLTRRLEERGACLRLVRTGRGRLRLDVLRPLELTEI